MKRLLACSSLLGLMILSTAACTTEETKPSATGDASTGANDAGDAGNTTTGDAGDGGATGKLGFRPSNLDSAAAELEAALNGPLGDLTLSDCGPQAHPEENGRLGCEAPGDVYKRIDASSGGIKYGVFVAKNITVAAGKTLAVGGDRPLILIALESITIDGSIEVTPGFAGAYALPNSQQDGVGPGAGKGSSNTTSGSGGGGGFCGKGGNGGAATATGGAKYGNAEISPLQGGSSGGALVAGQPGGAIQLIAGREIKLAAGSYIDAHGDGAGGGGGAGGAILIEAPTVKLLGAVTANGGGGGAPGGQAGKPGDQTSTPALGGVNAENINGGLGGAGTTANGTNGVMNTSLPDGEGSASGGGGAGWIRINTQSGAAEVSGGVISPALTSGCASQGKLR